MHHQSNGLDKQERDDILRHAAQPLPERPATHARGALAWARVSKSVQDSHDAQLAAIQKDARLHGVPVTRERYATGSRWNHKSPEWRALLSDIDSGEYSHLWLFKADRLAGDDVELVSVVRRALRAGMQVRDTVVGQIDNNNVGFLGMMSYHDIKATSDRTIMFLDDLAEQGIKVGGIPYGYMPQCRQHPCKCGLHGVHVPDPTKRQHIVELFARYDSGESLIACRRWFNDITGRRYSDQRIKGRLRDVYYVGIVLGRRTRASKTLGRYGRPKEEWSVTRHDHPIVDQALFDRVQARLILDSHVGQHRSKLPSHPLVGLMWCARCNRRMKYHRTRPNAATWRCELCNAVRGEKKVGRNVLAALSHIPFPNEQAAALHAQQIEQQRKDIGKQLKALDAQMDRLTRRRREWGNQVADGDITREDYKANIAENDRERDQIHAERDRLLTALDSTPASRDVARAVLERLAALGHWSNAMAAMPPDEQRTVYQTLVEAIVLDPQHGTLTVRFTAPLAAWYGKQYATVAMPNQMRRYHDTAT